MTYLPPHHSVDSDAATSARGADTPRAPFSPVISTSSTYELHCQHAGVLGTSSPAAGSFGASEGLRQQRTVEKTLATQHAALCEEYARMKKRGDRKGMKDLLPKLQKANHARFGVV